MSAKQHGVPCLLLLVLKQPRVLLRVSTVSVSMIKLLPRSGTDSRRPETCTRGNSRHTGCTVQATRASAQSWCVPPLLILPASLCHARFTVGWLQM